MIKNILVVCMGNICRSPIAEVVLRDTLSQVSEEFHVSSAGIQGLVGQPAAPFAVEVAQAKGYDLSAHRARQITFDLLKENDLILVMEQAQQKKIEFNFPGIYGRVQRLGNFSGFDIADPYKRPKPVFEQTLALIEHCVNDWKKYLISK